MAWLGHIGTTKKKWSRLKAIGYILFFGVGGSIFIYLSLDKRFGGTDNNMNSMCMLNLIYDQGLFRIIGGFTGLVIIVVLHYHQMVKGMFEQIDE